MKFNLKKLIGYILVAPILLVVLYIILWVFIDLFMKFTGINFIVFITAIFGILGVVLLIYDNVIGFVKWLFNDK